MLDFLFSLKRQGYFRLVRFPYLTPMGEKKHTFFCDVVIKRYIRSCKYKGILESRCNENKNQCELKVRKRIKHGQKMQDYEKPYATENARQRILPKKRQEYPYF